MFEEEIVQEVPTEKVDSSKNSVDLPEVNADYSNLFYRPKLDKFGKPELENGRVKLLPVEMKEMTDEDLFDHVRKVDPPWLRMIFPISMIINFGLVLFTYILNLWQPFLIALVVDMALLAIIFMAGDNFWIWFQYSLNKKKNWIFKIKSYANGRNELVFQPVKETEKFVYVDEAGKKRFSKTSTRRVEPIHNLASGIGIYREGYPSNLNIGEEYPFDQINRQIHQNTDLAVGAGILSVLDELIDLKGKKTEFMIYLLLGIIAIGMVIMIYLSSQNNPAAIAEAVKGAIQPLINPDSNAAVQVLSGG